MIKDIINRIIMELRYPIGTRLRLKGDYPWEDMHEVMGYSIYGRETYLVFKDGCRLNTERLDLIVEEEREKMFDKFGEFDSCEELNRAAAAQKAEGDADALYALAEENGIDREDAEDYLDGMVEELATPLMAAAGKLKKEEQELELRGILSDWKDAVLEICTDSEEMQRAVRRKGKSLLVCMTRLLKFAFENKIRVSDKVAEATVVRVGGREERMRTPLYMGIPNKKQVKQIITDYYGEQTDAGI